MTNSPKDITDGDSSFRTLLNQNLKDNGGPLVLPGVGTPLEALSAQRAGFPAVYISGYAVAAWRHGLPDIGLIAAAEMTEAAMAVRRVIDGAIACDADTGYGDVAAVHSTVRLLESIGVGAIQIEDQVWPKRCGHLNGKEVIDIDAATRKIRAAAAARRDPDTVIIARTDAIAPRGLEEAIERGHRFADAGADLIFIDAPTDLEQLARIGQELSVPLMVNMSEGGVTPALSASQLGELGFSVVLFPTSALRIAAHAFEHFFPNLASAGDTRPLSQSMWGLDELNALVGLPAYNTLERKTSA